MSGYIKYGMMLWGEEVFERSLDLGNLLIRGYYVVSIIALVCAVTYVVVHKSVKLYQRHLSNYLSKVKDYKKAYENEMDLSKKSKDLSQYYKNLKNLRKEIKRIVFWNGKKLFIPSAILNNNTDLSIDGKTPFTFKDELNKVISETKKSKVKILETIIGKKQTTKINSSVSVEELTEIDLNSSAVNKTEEKKKDDNEDDLLSILNENNKAVKNTNDEQKQEELITLLNDKKAKPVIHNNKQKKQEVKTNLNRIFVSDDELTK